MLSASSALQERPVSRRPLLFQVIAVTVLLALAVGTAATVLAVWTATQIDQQWITRQRGFVDRALHQRWKDIATEQESVTIWDDAVIKVAAHDLPWMDENVGVWMSSYFGHDRVYVLNPADKPTYAMRAGAMLPEWTYESDQATIEPLVAQLRRIIAAANGDRDAIAAAGVTDLLTFSGRPAFVSVKPIVPSTEHVVQAPDDISLHVSVVMLRPELLQAMGATYSVRDLHLATSDEMARSPHVTLANAAGDVVANVSWIPDRPGTATVSMLKWPFLAVVLLVSVVVGGLLRRLWHSTVEIEAGQEQTRFLAFHDPLTGLPNRTLFEQRLDEELAAPASTGSSVAIHLIDIDRFKNINDTMGHPVGDELVRQIGARLATAMRHRSMIARIGGDEFAVLQDRVSGPADVAALAERILAAFRPLFDLGGEHAAVSASIGAAVLSAEVTSRADLLRCADIALYEAKARGHGRYMLFAEEMETSVRRRRSIERGLRDALNTGVGLAVVYQPIFARDGRTIVGAESLVRWHDPVLGEVPAHLFVAVAEERGLIDALGEWVLGQACRMLQSGNLPRIAVNVSPLQLHDPNFPDRVLETLRRAGVAPSRLEIEVTEGVLMKEEVDANAALRRLQDCGVRIVLDDFGTGYSSLSYLQQYVVDKIKIDQAFTRRLGAPATDAIVRAIVSVARAMGRTVTAEGVETAEQRDRLLEIGCDELQGYLLCRPLPADELRLLLRGGRPDIRLIA